jgi:hypothetical protein
MKIKPNSKFKLDYVERAERACQIGMTDFELAQLFEVTETTINNWKNVYPEFADALRTGKAFADERVERALYSRAFGYSYAAEEVLVRPRAGKRGGSEVIRANVIKHVLPDVTAQVLLA